VKPVLTWVIICGVLLLASLFSKAVLSPTMHALGGLGVLAATIGLLSYLNKK
jgi:hypothetical protein